MSKLRPMGEILLDIEPFVIEMMEGHDLQHGDMYGLLQKYLEVHFPDHIEEYEDGSNPILSYGPKND